MLTVDLAYETVEGEEQAESEVKKPEEKKGGRWLEVRVNEIYIKLFKII